MRVLIGPPWKKWVTNLKEKTGSILALFFRLCMQITAMYMEPEKQYRRLWYRQLLIRSDTIYYLHIITPWLAEINTKTSLYWISIWPRNKLLFAVLCIYHEPALWWFFDGIIKMKWGGYKKVKSYFRFFWKVLHKKIRLFQSGYECWILMFVRIGIN